MILLLGMVLMSGCSHPFHGNKIEPPERPKPIGKACCDSKGNEYNTYKQKDMWLYGAELEISLAQCIINFK